VASLSLEASLGGKLAPDRMLPREASMVSTIYGGTSEIQRTIIAKRSASSHRR
jgi:alkylation response protein AidB-like acyl-CoA dehydrogenase